MPSPTLLSPIAISDQDNVLQTRGITSSAERQVFRPSDDAPSLVRASRTNRFGGASFRLLWRDARPPNVWLCCKPRKQAERPKDALCRAGVCQQQPLVR